MSQSFQAQPMNQMGVQSFLRPGFDPELGHDLSISSPVIFVVSWLSPFDKPEQSDFLTAHLPRRLIMSTLLPFRIALEPSYLIHNVLILHFNRYLFGTFACIAIVRRKQCMTPYRHVPKNARVFHKSLFLHLRISKPRSHELFDVCSLCLDIVRFLLLQ